MRFLCFIAIIIKYKNLYLQFERKTFVYITIIYNNISMYLTKEEKAEIFAKHGKTATDTGSAEGQIALFTQRINHLTEHLKKIVKIITLSVL